MKWIFGGRAQNSYEYYLYRLLTFVRINTHILTSFYLSPLNDRPSKDVIQKVYEFRKDTEGNCLNILDTVLKRLEKRYHEISDFIPLNISFFGGNDLKDEFESLRSYIVNNIDYTWNHKFKDNRYFFLALLKIRNEFSHKEKSGVSVEPINSVLRSAFEKILSKFFVQREAIIIKIQHIVPTITEYKYYIYNINDLSYGITTIVGEASQYRLSKELLYVARPINGKYEILYYITPFIIFYEGYILFFKFFDSKRGVKFFSPINKMDIFSGSKDSLIFAHIRNLYSNLERLLNCSKKERNIINNCWDSYKVRYWDSFMKIEKSFMASSFSKTQKENDMHSQVELFDSLKPDDLIALIDEVSQRNKDIQNTIWNYLNYLKKKNRVQRLTEIINCIKNKKRELYDQNIDKFEQFRTVTLKKYDNDIIKWGVIFKPHLYFNVQSREGFFEFEVENANVSINKNVWINNSFEVLLLDSNNKVKRCEILTQKCYKLNFGGVLGSTEVLGISRCGRYIFFKELTESSANFVVFDIKEVAIPLRMRIPEKYHIKYAEIIPHLGLVIYVTDKYLNFVSFGDTKKGGKVLTKHHKVKNIKHAVLATDHKGVFLIEKEDEVNKISYFPVNKKINDLNPSGTLIINRDIKEIVGTNKIIFYKTKNGSVYRIKNMDPNTTVLVKSKSDLVNLDYPMGFIGISARNKLYLYDDLSLAIVKEIEFDSNIKKVKISKDCYWIAVLLGERGRLRILRIV